jgi:hypothetical protein
VPPLIGGAGGGGGGGTLLMFRGLCCDVAVCGLLNGRWLSALKNRELHKIWKELPCPDRDTSRAEIRTEHLPNASVKLLSSNNPAMQLRRLSWVGHGARIGKQMNTRDPSATRSTHAKIAGREAGLLSRASAWALFSERWQKQP